MQNINACSACIARYGTDDTPELNDCCYNTCALFVDGNTDDIIKSECGQNCKRCIQNSVACKGKSNCELSYDVPVIRTSNLHFKSCLEKSSNNAKDALACCIRESNSHEEEERCIDGYNALINVHESFLFTHGINKKLLYLGFVITLLYVLIFNKYNFGNDQTTIFRNTTVIAVITYYVIFKVL